MRGTFVPDAEGSAVTFPGSVHGGTFVPFPLKGTGTGTKLPAHHGLSFRERNRNEWERMGTKVGRMAK